MRLLRTTEPIVSASSLHEFFDDNIPKYAILSHRWEGNELLYQDLQAGRNLTGPGFTKVQTFCLKALSDGYEWAWIDTCCIDKSSSAELSEAINAMYRWYRDSAECYAYLSDVHGVKDVVGDVTWPGFKRSAWFTRGWALQELIAPRKMLFLDKAWAEIGTRAQLMDEITAVTDIPKQAFSESRLLSQYSVAQIMSWASRRTTSRVEDKAYCLMGLFGINMPMLYGEGDRAFIRLQEEIMKVSDDESIFVWTEGSHQTLFHDQIKASDLSAFMIRPYEIGRTSRQELAAMCSTGLLAPRPSCFANSGHIVTTPMNRPPWGLTNKGLRIFAMLFRKSVANDRNNPRRFQEQTHIPLNCIHSGTGEHVTMAVSPDSRGQFFKIACVLMKPENAKADQKYRKHISYEEKTVLSEVFISLYRPG